MKHIAILLLSLAAAIGQTGTGTISGNVVDQSQKAVRLAVVTAIRNGLPPFSKSTKSSVDGAFQFQGLLPGAYSLCIQTPDDLYLDPCQWDGTPTTITLASGQAAAG